MRRFAILLLIIFIPIHLIAQLNFNLKGVADIKIHSIPKGTEFILKKIENDEYNVPKMIIVDSEKNGYSIDLKKNIDKITFSPTNKKEFWQIQSIKNGAYKSILQNGLQYDLRRELEEDAIDYMDYLNNNNLLFEDSYLESILYSLAFSIFPDKLDDGRPGILNIRIVKDINPNAFIFPNGTMFITTGLLSTLNSEEELISVMAHEISHFVLDHSVMNINLAVKREKRAIFWAALATGLAAAADTYISSNNEYYAPGALTMSTAILSFSIANAITERMGLNYSREQEYLADNCAVELMKFIDTDPTALSSALSKIKDYCTQTGNYLALSGSGSHPYIVARIEKIGKPTTFYSKDYDKIISFVNSFNAIVELNKQHLSSCMNLANRNIQANVATEEDYILLAMSTMYMYNTEPKNQEALELIRKAKTLNIYPTINLSKQEAIALLRLGEMNDAKTSLEQYKTELENESEKLDKIKNTNEWTKLSNHINKEYMWTVKMINKVSKL